jgi:peptidoglycan hydrolase-like protein with peptidoglycan-binding domain
LIKNTDNINQVLNIKSAILSITSNNQRDFGINTQGSDVKLLQQILNAQGFIVSKKGPGSKGNETNKFGSATKKALIKLQIKNNLLPATGYFGPKTKLYIKSLIK